MFRVESPYGPAELNLFDVRRRRRQNGCVPGPEKKKGPSEATKKLVGTSEERATLSASVARALESVLRRETRMVQKVIRCSVAGEERYIRLTVESWARPGPGKPSGPK